MKILLLMGLFQLYSYRGEAAETARITEPMFVELQATAAKREAYIKRQKASGVKASQEISEIGSDIEFYRAEALEYAKKKGLKSVTTTAPKVVFVLKDGKEIELENKLDGFDSAYYLFNANKPPAVVDEIVTFPSSGLYESLFSPKAIDRCDEFRKLVVPEINDIKVSKKNACDASQLYQLARLSNDWLSVVTCLKSGENQGPLPAEWIWMMMYANGFGVAKNLDFATKYACNVDDRSLRDRLVAAIDGMKVTSKQLDACDHVNTTPDIAVCDSIRTRAKFVEYEAKIDQYRPVDEQQRVLFDQMKAAAKVFMEKRSQLEVDLSGSGRGLLVNSEHDLQWRDFIETFEAIRQSKVRKYTLADLKKREAWMTDHLKKILSTKGGAEGSVNANDILSVQKAWENYRDATVAYGTSVHESNLNALRCWMTIKRNNMLKALQR